ncbi:hypothetical protein [Parasediminibacterium sp. JCM 36343]|uniref:hypothetical protein n=1 Tax=Parasediminibacterium sp. JCM 36343 TaxID=3374279 RepID=UPI00397D0F63
MKKNTLYLILLLLLLLNSAKSQLVTYSDPDKEDAKDLTFEVIGKLNGNIHIYKSYRDYNYINLYDINMHQVAKKNLAFMPEKVINVDFLQYPDFYYLFYQYQKKSVVYCMAIKFDNNAEKVGEPILLDTTSLSFSTSNKIYTIINSEDKQKLMLVKINRPDEKINQVTTVLLDKQLQLVKKTSMTLQMKERYATLSEFQIDNTGDLAFLKAFGSGQSDIVNKLTLVTKPAKEDTLGFTEVNIGGIFLDDIRLKVDNYNKHYLITSFFAKQRRGNTDGFFCYLWDKAAQKAILNTRIEFSDDFRADAKNEGSLKTALNDYFLRNIVIKKDGGVLLAAESAYTASNGSDLYNRWDGFGSPYSGFNNYSVYGAGGLYGNPFYRNYNTVTRYFADNIIVLSIDVTGKMEWSNIIRKAQQDENTDNFISYGILNTGDKVHFLFNLQEKRQSVFSDQSITPEGQITRSAIIRGLDKGYDFMPRHGKQTGIRQIIVPCQFRGYICFAKIDF